jgi:hypothetical protein
MSDKNLACLSYVYVFIINLLNIYNLILFAHHSNFCFVTRLVVNYLTVILSLHLLINNLLLVNN